MTPAAACPASGEKRNFRQDSCARPRIGEVAGQRAGPGVYAPNRDGRRGTSENHVGLVLVKYVVPEEGVDHVAHGDGQSGDCYIQSADLETPVRLVAGAFIRWQVGQLNGSQGREGMDNICRANHFRLPGKDALGKEIVDISVRV